MIAPCVLELLYARYTRIAYIFELGLTSGWKCLSCSREVNNNGACFVVAVNGVHTYRLAKHGFCFVHDLWMGGVFSLFTMLARKEAGARRDEKIANTNERKKWIVQQ